MRRGIGILLALAAAIAPIGCASGPRMVVAEFADVGDLVTRANVQQSDSVVGSVSSIELVDRDGKWIARVEMNVKEDTIAQEGSTAVVRSTSLLGEKYVDLVPPAEPGARLGPDDVIGLDSTSKAPELEDVFSQLGAILQGGALEDLARLSTAGAMILEGQEDNVGRVIDQTAKLVASLARERVALAGGLADLASASKTLAGGSETIARSLEVSDDALKLVADQHDDLEQLVVQLDRLAGPLGELTRQHGDDVDAQVRALNAIVPKLYEARDTLKAAVQKLPAFTKLFAEAIPGDYIQLDVLVESLPIALTASSPQDLLLEATR